MAHKKETIATRQRISSWMRTVMEQTGWSAEEWAKRAETSPTNITRLLSDPKTASTPTATTLAKLSKACASQPMLAAEIDLRGLFRSVPLLDRADVDRFLRLDKEMQKSFVEARREEGPTIAVTYKPSPRAIAVKIETDGLELRGIFRGDLIVIEPVDLNPPTAGSIVVAVVGGKMGAYLYEPPMLLTASREGGSPVMLKNVKLIGRAVHLERPLL